MTTHTAETVVYLNAQIAHTYEQMCQLCDRVDTAEQVWQDLANQHKQARMLWIELINKRNELDKRND